MEIIAGALIVVCFFIIFAFVVAVALGWLPRKIKVNNGLKCRLVKNKSGTRNRNDIARRANAKYEDDVGGLKSKMLMNVL